jgi:hypothetical protein
MIWRLMGVVGETALARFTHGFVSECRQGAQLEGAVSHPVTLRIRDSPGVAVSE